MEGDGLFPVFVKHSDQQPVQLQVAASYSVGRVKECITELLGCAAESQALFLVLGQDSELEDARLLSELSVLKWATLHLLLRFHDDAGSLVVFVEKFYRSSSRGQCVALETNAHDDVETVKRLLARQVCVHVCMYIYEYVRTYALTFNVT
jgi:hypothetical protein